MIQVIISPAKQMRVDSDAFAPRGIPPFPQKTARIVRALRTIEDERGSAGLKELGGSTTNYSSRTSSASRSSDA